MDNLLNCNKWLYNLIIVREKVKLCFLGQVFGKELSRELYCFEIQAIIIPENLYNFLWCARMIKLIFMKLSQ